MGVSLLLSALSFGQAAELADTVARIKASLVAVGTVQPSSSPRARFLGTGFAVSDSRHVLTNAHVIPKALDPKQVEYLVVFAGEGREASARKAAVVASDSEHDLAVIRIEGEPLRAVRLGDSSQVREGERYAFTGFPIGMILGFYPVTHEAIVSAITPIVIPAISATELTPRLVRQMQSSFRVFQLDATAYPGSSGSPLYDPTTGEVVGIVNKVVIQESKEHLLKSPSGISYAMPIKYAQELLRAKDIRF